MDNPEKITSYQWAKLLISDKNSMAFRCLVIIIAIIGIYFLLTQPASFFQLIAIGFLVIIAIVLVID